MKNFPDVTMVRCPVRGIVFYGDGLGESAFKTAKQCQDAVNAFRLKREQAERDKILLEPNRVVMEGNLIRVFTGGVLVREIEAKDKFDMRRKIGELPEWDTHNFVHV